MTITYYIEDTMKAIYNAHVYTVYYAHNDTYNSTLTDTLIRDF
jgi:hypothetical protein